MNELSPLRRGLIEVLADGHFHSGATLGEHFGISRAAVNNHVHVLCQLGLDIFCVKGRGYCLKSSLQLYDQQRLQQLAPTAPIDYVTQVNSTNDYLVANLGSLVKGQACVTERQSAGKGRMGRSWISPFGRQMILSVYWRLDQGVGAAMGLSLLVGCSVIRALEDLGFKGVELKWPNDLYLGGRKLAGILVELKSVAGEACHLIIGIGLNINLSADHMPSIDQPWAELSELSQIPLDRNQLTANVLNQLREDLSLFEREGLHPFMDAWRQHDCLSDRPVSVTFRQQQLEGIARGIDEQGALFVEIDGVTQRFVGGEVSLRLRQMAKQTESPCEITS